MPRTQKKKNNKKKITRIGIGGSILLGLTGIIPFCLCLTFLSLYIPPRIFWIPGIIDLAFPFLSIAALILGLIYLLFLKKRCILFFAAVLLNFGNISNYVQFNKPNTENAQNENTQIKLLSYNVNLFDYYALLDSNKLAIRNEILDFIETENADVVCLQEYYESVDERFRIASILKDEANLSYHTKIDANKKFKFGNVIFSKYPIIKSGKISDLSSLVVIYADIVKEKDTFRIYTMHLESNKLDNEDHIFYSELTSPSENTDIKEGAVKIIKKLRRASIVRATQMKMILADIKKSPYPVILCGDMNENPVSYVYHKACQELDDSFIEQGDGFGHTYQGIFPSYRIDYILHSKALKTIYFECLDVAYSDHRPIIAGLEVVARK